MFASSAKIGRNCSARSRAACCSAMPFVKPPNLTPRFFAAAKPARVRSPIMRRSFGKRCIDVKHERVGVRPQLGHDERDPLLHQAADEMHVTAKPIELGDDDRALGLPGGLDRGGQLRPALKCVRALAGLNFAERLSNLIALGVSKPGNSVALSLKPLAPTRPVFGC